VKQYELDGRKIAVMGHEKFLVQVGRGPKGSYKTQYTFDNLPQAVKYYACINIGRGYKKRLVCFEFGKPVLARMFS
jgi:hypothetical protein